MKIAITSGKGGTGKTTVSTGLFYVLLNDLKLDVQLLDCDVEEPDCQIFIKGDETGAYPVNMSIPVINKEKCGYCGTCKSVCSFNAILLLPSANFIEVIEDLCHGCGACSYFCPKKAIIKTTKKIGAITHYDVNNKESFIEGRMKIGNAFQTHVIKNTIKHAKQEGIVLFDSPPGTSCPVIATVSKADYVIMVTEPTPFGLHDFKLMAETVKEIGKMGGVVINKTGLKYKPLYDYINKNHIPLLGEIPFKKEYALLCSQGNILPEKEGSLKSLFIEIAEKIIDGKNI